MLKTGCPKIDFRGLHAASAWVHWIWVLLQPNTPKRNRMQGLRALCAAQRWCLDPPAGELSKRYLQNLTYISTSSEVWLQTAEKQHCILIGRLLAGAPEVHPSVQGIQMFEDTRT